MNRHDYDVVLQHSYDMGIQAGIEKGREEGKVEGRVEGKEEGREEGKEEAKTDVAKKMKELGIDTETITQVTGLDYATISNL